MRGDCSLKKKKRNKFIRACTGVCRRIFRDKRGEMTYIDSVVSMIVLMLLIVLTLNIFSFASLKQDLSYIASELAGTASAAGCVSTEVGQRFSQLCLETGLDASSLSYSFEGTVYLDGSSRIQYGKLIYVKVSCRTKLMGSGIFTLPASVSSASSCLCEKYWKTE